MGTRTGEMEQYFEIGVDKFHARFFWNHFTGKVDLKPHHDRFRNVNCYASIRTLS